MNNIFVIDKNTKCNLGTIDFTPHKGDRVFLKIAGRNIEIEVECVLHDPSKHATLIFVNIVEPYYIKMIKEIRW